MSQSSPEGIILGKGSKLISASLSINDKEVFNYNIKKVSWIKKNMEEICKLVAEKGFKAKTFSTGWTLDFYLDKGKDILITPTAEYILLCEIQKWIREEFKIDISIDGNFLDTFYYELFYIEGKSKYENASIPCKTYEEALKAGIKETLKTI